ncbi:MAG: ABC transporter permease [Hyphomicrobiales bacterium]
MTSDTLTSAGGLQQAGKARTPFLKQKRVQQMLFLALALCLWEAIARSDLVTPLLFPSVPAILDALWRSIVNGELLLRAYWSLYLIGSGFVIAIALATVAAGLAMWSNTVKNLVETIMTVMHPLPGIALFPVILLWVGTGPLAITIILVHSVLWPTIVNLMAGFNAIPRTQLEVGRVMGLNTLKLLFMVRIPAAFPYIYAGIRISWARAWRSLVAAEMVFGASGVEVGIGWYIYQHRYLLDTAGVFAGLIVIVIIGVTVEEFILGTLEKRTIKRWGMVATST